MFRSNWKYKREVAATVVLGFPPQASRHISALVSRLGTNICSFTSSSKFTYWCFYYYSQLRYQSTLSLLSWRGSFSCKLSSNFSKYLLSTYKARRGPGGQIVISWKLNVERSIRYTVYVAHYLRNLCYSQLKSIQIDKCGRIVEEKEGRTRQYQGEERIMYWILDGIRDIGRVGGLEKSIYHSFSFVQKLSTRINKLKSSILSKFSSSFFSNDSQFKYPQASIMKREHVTLQLCNQQQQVSLSQQSRPRSAVLMKTPILSSPATVMVHTQPDAFSSKQAPTL